MDAAPPPCVSLACDTHIGTCMMMKEKWDLLVLDLMMPGGGGFALLEKVHQSPDKAKIPVIILTGKTIDNEVRMKAEAYHVSDIILKPYKSKQFVERIRKVIPN